MAIWSAKRSSRLQFRRSNSRLRRASLDFERLEERVVLANLLQNPGAELGLSGWTTTRDFTLPFYIGGTNDPSWGERSFFKSYAAGNEFGRARLTQRVSVQSIDLSAGGIVRFGGDTRGKVPNWPQDNQQSSSFSVYFVNGAGQ